MKKLSIIIGLNGLANFLNAQSINVSEGNENFSVGSKNCIITTIYENKMADVLDDWKKVLKDYKNESVKDKKGEVFADNLLVKEWGNNTVDVYSRFFENKKEKTVRMVTAVDMGGAFLSSGTDKEKYTYFEKVIKEFAIKTTKGPLADQLKDNEKKLANLEDDQKSLEKKNENLKNDISDYKSKISKNESNLVVKESELVKKKGELEIQKKVVEASAGAVSEQAKASQKIYDKLAGQLKDLENEKKDLKEGIEKNNERTKDAEKDIKKNEEEQVKKKDEIKKQKEVVEEFKKRLEKIN